MDEAYLDMYLTPEDFEAAKKNGISEKLARTRFYGMNWSKRRTIHQPMQEKNHDLKQLQQEAKEKYGVEICINTLGYRLNNGKWTEKEAISIPVGKYHGTSKHSIHGEYIKLAKENGIPTSTYMHRYYRGWTKEDAATEPVHVKHRTKIAK